MFEWLKNPIGRLRDRVVREKQPPEFIARGWAIGMFYGLAVPFGFQLYVSIPTAFLLKASKIGATVGTCITNPITIIFIYPAQCWFGAKLMCRDLTWNVISNAFTGVFRNPSFETLSSLGGEIVIPFLFGGFVMALVGTPLTYFVVLKWVRQYRSAMARLKSRSIRERGGGDEVESV